MTPDAEAEAEGKNGLKHLILVVRLDGALLRRDLAAEPLLCMPPDEFFQTGELTDALRSAARSVLRQPARASSLEHARESYDPNVADYTRSWRAEGGRTVLLTERDDEPSARRLADRLGIFDEIRSIDPANSSNGLRTADCLVEWFGEGGFAYVGCDESDLAVWKRSALVVVAGPVRELLADAGRIGKSTERLPAPEGSWTASLLALRPHQWLKNLLVFIPMLAGHHMDAATVTLAVAAFVAFSLVASSFYLFNDLVDLRTDQLHPRKSGRPIASGALPVPRAVALATVVGSAGLVASAAIGWTFLLVMVVYILITTSYSLFFKRQAVIDICVLAALYTLRIIAGAAATGISLSVWLLAFSLFLFFSLAAVKRQTELVDVNRRGELKPLGRGYHVEDLPIVSTIAIAAGFVSVLVLALYINSAEVLVLYSHPVLLWGMCVILLYWLTYMVIISHRGVMHDDPIVFAVGDRVSQICLACSALLILASAWA